MYASLTFSCDAYSTQNLLDSVTHYFLLNSLILISITKSIFLINNSLYHYLNGNICIYVNMKFHS